MLRSSSSMRLDRYKVCFQMDISHVKQVPLADEGHPLASVLSRAQLLALLCKGATAAASARECFQTPHRILSLLDSSMVLLPSSMHIRARTMLHVPPQRLTDGFRRGGVFIGGHLLCCVTHRLQALFEAGFGRFPIISLAQAYLDPVAALIASPIQLPALTLDFSIGLICRPLCSGLALALGFQCSSKHRSDAFFPIAHGLVGQRQATCEEHCGPIPQTQRGAQPPENHEQHDLSRRVHIMEWTAGSLMIGTLAGETGDGSRAPFRLLGAGFRVRSVIASTR